jgi:RimJ/RimL family protein N-acetyltransferase
MIPDFNSQVPPQADAIQEWLSRLRAQQGLAKAQETLVHLTRKFPDHTGLQALRDWHDPVWWKPIEFGAIRMERRGPEHFEFLWSLVLQKDFAHQLKHLPPGLTPRDLMLVLSNESMAIIPESRSITWVIFKGDLPIGISMFVNINFKNRTAEQIMGIMPGYDTSFLVADAYFSSLLFAYNCLGLNKVQGLIYDSNESAATLQQRFGFQREGRWRQAVWNEELQRYQDLIQISLLHEEFAVNRFIQRYIGREERSAFLMCRHEWPRSTGDRSRE